MNITRWAIERNRVALVSLAVILFAGISAYQTMPRAEDPGFIIRRALVVTYFPGASPRRVEELVTDRLEETIQEMPEIDFIRSESKTGVSTLFVNVQERYTAMRPIWDSLRRKVESASSNLPDGVVGPFVNDEFGDVFGTIVTITGEGYDYAELKEVADEVRDELLRIDEVAKVDLYGNQAEQIFVEYSSARLAEMGISASQLKRILEDRNIIIPGGAINLDRERIALEPTGNFDSIDDLKKTIVQRPAGALIYLEDIAEVRRGYVDPPDTLVRSTGTPSLALGINLREGGNIMRLGEQVQETMVRLQERYPIGIEFDFTSFQAEHVEAKVSELFGSLAQAVVIVLAVMLVFLGFRTGFVVASLIPMAMIMSIWIMSLLDIGLDQMSLASLIIALGMLVDNSIVMSESIMVQMGEGKPRLDAAVDSANELRVPLLTSSLTTAAAFLPIYLAESATGEYTAPLFKVVAIALLSSWVLSLTMIPLLCVLFLKVKKREESSPSGGIYRFYRRTLVGLLRRKGWVLAVTLVVFLGSMQLFGALPQLFFPPNDKAIFTVVVELPEGTPIERTADVVQSIERHMVQELKPRGLENWMTFIGQSAPRFFLGAKVEPAKPNYAMIVVNAESQEEAAPLMREVEAYTFDHFPDARSEVSWLPLGPPATAPVQVRIGGRDEAKVFEIVDQVKAHLATLGTKNIRDDWGQRGKKILVNVDQPRALRAGLTSTDVAISLQSALSGIETTEYREGDKVIPVTLRSAAADRQDLGKLDTVNIYAQASGRSVPLNQVADVQVEFQPARIYRRNRLKTVTISADLQGDATAIEVARTLDLWLQEQQRSWPVGYVYTHGGELEQSGKANASINAKLPIAMFIIVLLLVAQFNSIRKPLIILLTIPLGLIGVVLGLLGAGSYFGFMTLLGIISLTGIVINNAIVLLERIELEIKDNGLPPAEAVVTAAERRFRPILLTTATTVGGLLPLWLSGGPMWEPMAIAIIFGLLFATLLTLGIVPVLYATFFRVSYSDYRESRT